MPFGQLLAGEGWPEIVPVRLLQNLQSLSLSLARQLAIGRAAAKSVHDHTVASPAHPFQQRPHPTLTHAYSLGRLPLAHPPFLCSFQPIQLIPLLLAHRDSFHPLALRLSRGTFYFGQLGTSHFGADAKSGNEYPVTLFLLSSAFSCVFSTGPLSRSISSRSPGLG